MDENIEITQTEELDKINYVMHKIIGAEKENLKKPDNARATEKQMVEKIVNIVEREIR